MCNDKRIPDINHQSERISLGCAVVCIVFFAVLSQIVLQIIPDGMSQLFRPIIIFLLFIQMVKYRAGSCCARTLSLFLAIYYMAVVAMTSWQRENLMLGSANALYALMFFTVAGTKWNCREIRWILMACFFAAAICATVLLFSNPFMDFSQAVDGHVKLFYQEYNRNLNAYCYAIGAVLGLTYLVHGKNVPRFVVFICFSVVIYALLYSQCRGAFLCANVGMVISLYGKYVEIRKVDRLRYIVLVISTILGMIVLWYLIKNSSLSRLIDGESTSGRDEGIRRALHMYSEMDSFEKIFGAGFTYEASQLKAGQLGAHFVYATYLIATGAVGLVILILFYLSCLKTIRGYVPYAFAILALLRTCFEGMDYYIYIPLLLAFVISQCAQKNEMTPSDLFSFERKSR